jgi:radical SAM protein with 4Fe4S-binding SPASM domain
MANIRSAGMTFSVSTTGYDLDLFEAVLASGPRMVNLSLDPGLLSAGMKSSVEEVKKRIELCREADIPVKLSGVVMPGQLEEVKAYLRALPQLLEEFPNIRKIALKERYPLGAFAGEPRLAPVELTAYGKVFQSMRAPSGLEKLAWVNWPQLHAPLDRCRAGESIMAVLPDGDYAACSLLFYLSDSFRLGNLVNDSVLLVREKLAGSVESRERQSAELKHTNKLCSCCKVRTRCGTGCAAMLPTTDKPEGGPLCKFHAGHREK